MTAIEAQLNERRAHDGALQGVEDTVNGRLRELHNQLAHGMLALDRRDGELHELKTQVQTLAQRVGYNGLPPPLASVSRPDSLAEGGTAAPLGGFAASLQPVELGSVVTSASMDSGANLLQPALPGNGLMTDPIKVPAVDLHRPLVGGDRAQTRRAARKERPLESAALAPADSR